MIDTNAKVDSDRQNSDVRFLRQILHIAHLEISSMTKGENVVKAGGSFGDVSNDTEIAADIHLGDVFIDLIQNKSFAEKIFVEGREPVIGDHEGSYHWFIDPLDGSLNFKTRGATIGLPYSSVVTVGTTHRGGRNANKLTFKTLHAAGIIDLRNGDCWVYAKPYHTMEGDFSDTLLNGNIARTAKEAKLDLGRMVVIGEMYYPQNRELLARAFHGQKGWLRNPGSAAYEMALVSSGQVAAYICETQKQHELGAAYLLVKGAGGVVVDFDGNDLGPREYDFKTQTPVVLACNQEIANQILELLHKAKA